MTDAIIHLVFALPLAVMVLNFGFTLLFKFGAKSTYAPKDYSYTPSVSVLLPCFNEGQHVYETIESIVRKKYGGTVEIIAVDDCSADDSYEWLLKAAADFPNVQAFRNEVNSGKHHSLAKALEASTGEILICIDSDCIFAEDAIAEMMATLADPAIGAVGGRVGISNPRENIITQCQTLVYYYAFHIMKMAQNWTRNVICISGCLFAVRRELFVGIVNTVKERNWFGIGVRDGEDRYMTHLLLLAGEGTYINNDAQCWTAAPNNLRQLFMQQLRWRRSGLRDLFWSIKTFSKNLDALHPLSIVLLVVPSILSVLWPWMVLYAFMSTYTISSMMAALQLYLAIYVVAGVGFWLYAQRNNPEQLISPIVASMIGVWLIMDSFFITLLAICTFDVGEWGTRGTSTQKA